MDERESRPSLSSRAVLTRAACAAWVILVYAVYFRCFFESPDVARAVKAVLGRFP